MQFEKPKAKFYTRIINCRSKKILRTTSCDKLGTQLCFQGGSDGKEFPRYRITINPNFMQVEDQLYNIVAQCPLPDLSKNKQTIKPPKSKFEFVNLERLKKNCLFGVLLHDLKFKKSQDVSQLLDEFDKKIKSYFIHIGKSYEDFLITRVGNIMLVILRENRLDNIENTFKLHSLNNFMSEEFKLAVSPLPFVGIKFQCIDDE